MTLPAGIRENICHEESTLPGWWLEERRIDCAGSIIDSVEPEVWARAQATIALRYAWGVRTHLVWNSEGAGLPAWPHPQTLEEELYLERWREFMQGCPEGAVASATAGNEASTAGWVTTEGAPITTLIMAQTAEAFANASARFPGLQAWATSIHTQPEDAIELARAVSGLCYGVPYHPYFRALEGKPSTPWSNQEGKPNEWRYGTVEAVADLFASEEGYPDDVACMFDELGCPTVLDGIGATGQSDFCASTVRFTHPKIDRLLYFAGPVGAVPQAEIDKGLDFYIEGRPAELVYFNPETPDVPDVPEIPGGGTVAAKYPERALRQYWRSIDESIDFDISPPPNGLGIARHWADDPYKYGPPVAKEVDEGDGNTIQLFAKRPIRWTPGGPVDVEP